MASVGLCGRLLLLVLSVCLAAGQTVQTCPGEGRFAPSHRCDQAGSVFKVCAKLLMNPGSPTLQGWGSKDYFAWLELTNVSPAVTMMHSNNGDHACVSMWTFATVMNSATCANVHLNCAASDLSSMLSHYTQKGMTPVVTCVQQKCPGAVASGQVDAISDPNANIGQLSMGSMDSLTPPASTAALSAPSPTPTLSTPTLPSPTPSPSPTPAPLPAVVPVVPGSAQDPRSQVQAQGAPATVGAAPTPDPSLMAAVPSLPAMSGGAVVSPGAPVAAPGATAVSAPGIMARGAAGGPSADTSGFAAGNTPSPTNRESSSSSGSDLSSGSLGSLGHLLSGLVFSLLFCCCVAALCFKAAEHPDAPPQMKAIHQQVRIQAQRNGLQTGLGGMDQQGMYGQQNPQGMYGQPGQQPQTMNNNMNQGGGWGAYPAGERGSSFHGAQQGSFSGAQQGSFHGAPPQQGSFSGGGGGAYNAYGPNPSSDSHMQQQQGGYGGQQGAHGGQQGGYGGQQGDYRGQQQQQQQQQGGAFQHDAYRRGMSGFE